MTGIAASGQKAGLSFWIVAGISVLWNAFGGFDYTMTKMRDPSYLKAFPPEMMPIIDAFPAWVTLAWALGVWGAVLGSVLLLLRSRFAVYAYAVSLSGLAASTAYQATIEMPASVSQPVITAIIWAEAIFVLWYARHMARKGVLR